MKQIPSFKIIYVRFVDKAEEAVVEVCSVEPRAKKRKPQRVESHPTNHTSTKMESGASPSKFVPRSLSVVDMIKLGKVINKKTTSVQIYTFDMKHMTWSGTPRIAEFTIKPEPFGVGGFRKAFKATSHNKNFEGSTWVIKKYLPKVLNDIEVIGQTVEEHTKKVVQMHYLARNFTAKMKEELIANGKETSFGETFCYKKIYLGKIGDDVYVTVEELVDGTFVKYINNNGDVCGENVECLAHFSYERSQKEVMVPDIQGCGCSLFDLEIASKVIMSDDEVYLFCTGNLSINAINNFIGKHKCNLYCQRFDLSDLQ